ncbi:MAG: glycosyltransferase family 39 protein, partial [Candidatus Acidiferrales bacterium]
MSKRLCCSVFFIACVAFALRAAILYVIGRGMPVPGPANAPYGFEVGRVAESIALGKGFSSPLLLVDTGPTAYLCPAYPYLLASIFKLWGIYSLKSRMIIQTLNCLFSALTIFPIYAIAKRTFGGTVAVFSSWLWVVLPTAWHIPIADIWDTALSAFCFAVIFLATLALSEQRQLIRWAGYG